MLKTKKIFTSELFFFAFASFYLYWPLFKANTSTVISDNTNALIFYSLLAFNRIRRRRLNQIKRCGREEERVDKIERTVLLWTKSNINIHSLIPLLDAKNYQVFFIFTVISFCLNDYTFSFWKNCAWF